MKLVLALTLLARLTASRPQGGFGDSSPSFGDSSPSFGDSSPSFGDSSPSFGDSSPGFGSGSPSLDNGPKFGNGNPTFDETPSFGGGNPSFGDNGLGFEGGNPSSGIGETDKNKPSGSTRIIQPSPLRENIGNSDTNRPDRVVEVGSPTFTQPIITPSNIVDNPTNRGGKIIIDNKQNRPITNGRIVSPTIIEDSQTIPLCRASGDRRLNDQECCKIRKALPKDTQLISKLGC
ncbi:hypothetical protein CDD81_5924 [Ophiocordyceps australis]|uniref:Uncharacterized protein n=1 Tax=Ophiocordyceps australis TaxID=1399860 RepID=A0A2C5YHM8_9HYPO|nr:hypothetical protein CDD81_5924 [Ophiocordyceps australis]